MKSEEEEKEEAESLVPTRSYGDNRIVDVGSLVLLARCRVYSVDMTYNPGPGVIIISFQLALLLFLSFDHSGKKKKNSWKKLRNKQPRKQDI